MTTQELIEYESICAAEREAETQYWQRQRLAAQIVAIMGEEEMFAALELADLCDWHEFQQDIEWSQRGA